MNSFSSIYKSYSFTQHAKFNLVVFQNLQDSAIYINQKPVEIVKRLIDSSFIIDENATFSDCNVENCVFKGVKCKTEAGGGAITMLSKTCNLATIRSGFNLCYSIHDGAGIDAEGYALNVNQTCFLGCLALQSGQAIYMSGDALGENMPFGNVQYTSIEQCSPPATKGARESIFMSRGTEFAAYLNNTENHIVEFGSCFVSAYTKRLFLHYSNFIDCQGGNGFWMHELTNSDVLERCNVVRCAAKKETGIFTFEKCSSAINLVGWTFKNNKCPVYFITGQVTLKECVFDVKKTAYMFQRCEYELINTLFAQGSELPTRYIPSQITWGCWAFGKPSPTASKSLPPIEAAQEDATSGSIIFVVVLMLGGAIGVLVFYLFNKAEEVYAQPGMSGVDIA